ncbi:MAG: peptide chain release factor N(5)-glutamine methyltransferase [Holosporales bacterium]|jgi:release factor glutamine methyltransferase|nr:peptide chain release factor N(5)-glutamine methyltransferase [Holosporales bacterium]
MLVKFADLVGILERAGVERPLKDIKLLVCSVCGCSYGDLLGLPSVLVSDSDFMRIKGLVQRRCTGEPLTKILGAASFWEHRFLTNHSTLDPRPESEIIVETVLRYFPHRSQTLSFLDLGTGTGCLLLSCLYEYAYSNGLGIDKSEKAVQIAVKNAEDLGLLERAHFFVQDWNDSIPSCQNIIDASICSAGAVLGAVSAPIPVPVQPSACIQSLSLHSARELPAGTLKFDVVLCNPPYIQPGATLSREVLFDPPEALFGGEDGLQAYRDIFAMIPNSMVSGALLFLEIGIGQSSDVLHLIPEGVSCVEIVNDLQGIPRVMVIKKA